MGSPGTLPHLSNTNAAPFLAQRCRANPGLPSLLFSGIITGFNPKVAQVGLSTLVVPNHGNS